MEPTVPTSIIGVAGRKGSGKDTFARPFIDAGWRPHRFAGGIKAMLAGLLAYNGATPEMIDEMLEGALKEVASPLLAGKSPREAMQTLGEEWGRRCMGTDFWVDTTVNVMLFTQLSGALMGQYPRFILLDVRHQNEVDAILRTGGTVVRLTRPGLPDGPFSMHASETGIETLQGNLREVVNDGTIEELHAKAWRLVDLAVWGEKPEAARHPPGPPHRGSGDVGGGAF